MSKSRKKGRVAGPLRLSGKRDKLGLGEPGGEGLVSRLRISLISREPGEALEVFQAPW